MDAPLTSLSYLADSGCEVGNYEESEIYALIPRVDKEGMAYLAILIENKA